LADLRVFAPEEATIIPELAKSHLDLAAPT
jgi:hypothetical protein